MIAQVLIVETVSWPNTANPVSINSSGPSTIDFYPFAYNGTCLTVESDAPQPKFYAPPSLHIIGRAMNKKKRLMVFQRVQSRRNRNLHIQ